MAKGERFVGDKIWKNYYIHVYTVTDSTEMTFDSMSYTFGYRFVLEKITPLEFARVIGMTRSTVEYAIRKGYLKYEKDSNGRVWLLIQDCYRYLDLCDKRTEEQRERFHEQVCYVYQVIKEKQRDYVQKMCGVDSFFSCGGRIMF